MSEICFQILNIMTFYYLLSFFDLSYALFHKSAFFKKIFFFKNFFVHYFFHTYDSDLDLQNTFSYAQDYDILWNIIVFWLNISTFSKISFFQKKFFQKKMKKNFSIIFFHFFGNKFRVRSKVMIKCFKNH